MANSAYEVQKMYLAYFGRPADPIGLYVWQHSDAATMQAGFAASAEYAALYSGMTAEQRVNQVYQNLLGRSAEHAGLAYWVNEFNAGRLNVDSLALAIQNGAQGSDSQTVQNRITYATVFTSALNTLEKINGYSGNLAASNARIAVSVVTSDAASLTTAVNNLPATTTAILAGVSPATATTSGGSASTTFTVAEDGVTHAVSFSGTATGSIAIAWSGAVGSTIATFTRSGLSGTANFATATSIALAAADTLSASAANLAGVTISGGSGTVTLTDTTLAAATLTALDATIAGTLNASTVTTITGTAAQVAAAAGAAGITKAANFALTLTAGSMAATDLTAIDAATTTAVNAAGATAITGTAAQIAAVAGSAGITKPADFTAQPTAGSMAATDLTAIDAVNTTAVDASLATAITGAAAEISAVATAIGAGTITHGGDWNAAPTTSATVAQVNTIDARNGNGTITATISDSSAATLAGLTGTHAYTTTIAAGTAAAADLLAIDTATSVAVGAAAVTTITGSFADLTAVKAAITATTITVSGTQNVDMSDSGANLTGQTYNATGSADILRTVGTNNGAKNLSALTGFEAIYISASANAASIVTVADGASVTINAISGSVNVQLGSGGQTFVGSNGISGEWVRSGAGADVLTGNGGPDRFQIGATASLNTALDKITDFTPGTDFLALAVLPVSLVASAGADFSTAADVASTGTTAGSLATDIATAVAAQIVAGANFWATTGDTIAVKITGASVAGTGVTYIVQNQGADATYDAAADTVVALIGTSIAPTTLAHFVAPS